MSDKKPIERLFSNDDALSKKDLDELVKKIADVFEVQNSQQKVLLELKTTVDGLSKRIDSVEQGMTSLVRQYNNVGQYPAQQAPMMPQQQYVMPNTIPNKIQPHQGQSHIPSGQFNPLSVPNIPGQGGSVQPVPQFNGRRIA